MYIENITYIALQPDILSILYQPDNLKILHQLYGSNNLYIEELACEILFQAALGTIKNDDQLKELVLRMRTKAGKRVGKYSVQSALTLPEITCIYKWINQVLTNSSTK
nr:MAG TPA: hypothetical protein [Caudoviricetes sp.]